MPGMAGLAERYLLLQDLGQRHAEEGRGQLRVAQDKATGESVVVKSVRRRDGGEAAVCGEASVLRQLEGHPHIVQLLAVCEDEEHRHTVMERCWGGSVDKRLCFPGQPLAEALAASLTHQVAKALAHCHAHDIAHLDVSPSSILFTSPHPALHSSGKPEGTSKPVVVKLASFGRAANLGARLAAGPPLTCDASFACCAPEVLANRPCGKEADIWSLGVVLYFILSARYPFGAPTTSPELYRLAAKKGKVNFNGPPWHNVSSPAKHLLLQLLHREPSQRPTIHEVLSHPWLVSHCGATRDMEPFSLPTSPSSFSTPCRKSHLAAGRSISHSSPLRPPRTLSASAASSRPDTRLSLNIPETCSGSPVSPSSPLATGTLFSEISSTPPPVHAVLRRIYSSPVPAPAQDKERDPSSPLLQYCKSSSFGRVVEQCYRLMSEPSPLSAAAK